MEPTREFGKLLIVAGALIAVVGALLMMNGRLPLRLGRLPGDIAYRSKNSSFYFPIVTCLVVSAVLTIVFWLVNGLRR
jgi:membrane associated rhomboid family serine protease